MKNKRAFVGLVGALLTFIFARYNIEAAPDEIEIAAEVLAMLIFTAIATFTDSPKKA